MSNTTTSPQPSPQLPPEYPPIDPTNFDLILIGTSLPSAIISAAASTASKSVLHIDPHPFYGSLYSSLSPSSLLSLSSTSPSADFDAGECAAVPVILRPLFSDLTTAGELPENAQSFLLDIAGPRVFFCADKAVDLLLRSEINNYLEFKAVELSLIYQKEEGRMVRVPDSRSAIFKDKSLSLIEKNQLMKFFKLVQQHLQDGGGEGGAVFSDEELESPFFEFLAKKGLPKNIQRIILYAIALADHDQENMEGCKDLLKTKDGINRLALYHTSIGRFPNAQSAMLYPMYGQGELPQAFCRRAAVKGCIYVLRMPVEGLLADKDSGLYRGVKLASGQEIFSPKLVIDSHLVLPPDSPLSRPDEFGGSSQHPRPRDIKKVARGICISGTSLNPDVSNLLIVFPPRSFPEQATAVRALQLSSNTGVCPVGMFVVYLSAVCDDASQGKNLLTAAMNGLFKQPTSGVTEADSTEDPQRNSVAESASLEEQKPVLVWSALYIQEITEGSINTIGISPSPDENLSYNDVIVDTEKMFQQMFPGEAFFPEKASEDVEDSEDDPEW